MPKNLRSRASTKELRMHAAAITPKQSARTLTELDIVPTVVPNSRAVVWDYRACACTDMQEIAIRPLRRHLRTHFACDNTRTVQLHAI
eukprot:scaffold4648_cov295-Prasinococcus_capsulatus_cf.AAC.3